MTKDKTFRVVAADGSATQEVVTYLQARTEEDARDIVIGMGLSVKSVSQLATGKSAMHAAKTRSDLWLHNKPIFITTVLIACAIAASLFVAVPSYLASSIFHRTEIDTDGSNFEVISSNRTPPHKASFDIRLYQAVDKNELERIARVIRNNSNTRNINNIYIAYYLPEMEVGDGAWATADWTPNLKVEIVGLEADMYRESSSTSRSSVDEILIGRWVDQRPFVASAVSLVRRNDSISLIQVYNDGSSETRNVRAVDGRYYIDSNVYLVINRKGNLEWFDNKGHFLTCTRLP